jgi:hypothetical protein
MALQTRATRYPATDWSRIFAAGVPCNRCRSARVTPFLPAVCWAIALAIVAEPLRALLHRRFIPPSITALIIIAVVLALLIGPGAILVRALVGEASDVMNRLAHQDPRVSEVYTSAAKVQELAREYTFLAWRKSEVVGARDAPVKGPAAA